jgi:hypothetical protein
MLSERSGGRGRGPRMHKDLHTGLCSISMSIDGSEGGLIGIPLGWGLYGPEPECTVVELSGES